MVLSGVPQGSVLGPLLFLMFVNELPLWIQNEMRMFADDTKIWCKIKTDNKNSSGDEIANVNFLTMISHTYFKHRKENLFRLIS